MTFSYFSIHTSQSDRVANYFFFFLRFIYLLFKIYLFTFGCGESLLLHVGFCLGFSCGGFSCCRAQAVGVRVSQHAGPVFVGPRLWSTASIVVANKLSCSEKCGLFLDQGLNWCLLHCKAILNHWTTREAPIISLFITLGCIYWLPSYFGSVIPDSPKASFPLYLW